MILKFLHEVRIKGAHYTQFFTNKMKKQNNLAYEQKGHKRFLLEMQV